MDLNDVFCGNFRNYLDVFFDCDICPRACGVNRFSSDAGYCGGSADINIASICEHHGEEPLISGRNGICNIFFGGCNLRCVYCQNFQISSGEYKNSFYRNDLNKVIEDILRLLDKGCHAVGFVSPSHYLPHMRIIIEKLKQSGRNPVFVMNTNAYDKTEVIRAFEGIIDVYLPDFKYMDSSLSKSLSDAPSYPEVASLAIREMFRQKGSSLKLNKRGEAESGLIIRHLVLPGYVENSLAVLRYIANEISRDVHISLMSQYYPAINVKAHPTLNRRLTNREYGQVIEEMHRLGFTNGWVQELDSSGCFNPDFRKDDPFC